MNKLQKHAERGIITMGHSRNFWITKPPYCRKGWPEVKSFQETTTSGVRIWKKCGIAKALLIAWNRSLRHKFCVLHISIQRFYFNKKFVYCARTNPELQGFAKGTDLILGLKTSQKSSSWSAFIKGVRIRLRRNVESKVLTNYITGSQA